MSGKHLDPSTEQTLSIWFFVGVLMLSTGLIILGEGIYELAAPAAGPQNLNELPANVLARLHPALWWGFLMSVFGGFYTFNFRPGKG